MLFNTNKVLDTDKDPYEGYDSAKGYILKSKKPDEFGTMWSFVYMPIWDGLLKDYEKYYNIIEFTPDGH